MAVLGFQGCEANGLVLKDEKLPEVSIVYEPVCELECRTHLLREGRVNRDKVMPRTMPAHL